MAMAKRSMTPNPCETRSTARAPITAPEQNPGEEEAGVLENLEGVMVHRGVVANRGMPDQTVPT
jgi:hypothetical protein